jgi:hypothetical protein
MGKGEGVEEPMPRGGGDDGSRLAVIGICCSMMGQAWVH